MLETRSDGTSYIKCDCGATGPIGGLAWLAWNERSASVGVGDVVGKFFFTSEAVSVSAGTWQIASACYGEVVGRAPDGMLIFLYREKFSLTGPDLNPPWYSLVVHPEGFVYFDTEEEAHACYLAVRKMTGPEEQPS